VADAPTPVPTYTQPAYTYVGPTPADPFAMSGMDIFEALEMAEQRKETMVVAEAPQPPSEMDVQPEAAVPAAPVIQPIVIGATASEAPPKKGWWRR